MDGENRVRSDGLLKIMSQSDVWFEIAMAPDDGTTGEAGKGAWNSLYYFLRIPVSL